MLEKHELYQPWHPWSIQVELVQGCNRSCWFCGIQGWDREKRKDFRYIDLDVLRKAFTDLNEWLPGIRVEVDLHGEPTIHPQVIEAVRTMREAMPGASLQLQTNTELWASHWPWFVSEMQKAGLTVLAMNAYKKGLYEWWVDEFTSAGFPFIDYFHGNDERKSINHRYKPGTFQVFLLDNLGEMNVQGIIGKKKRTAKRFHNSGGAGLTDLIAERTGKPARTLPLHAKCSKVFRELNLSWDGRIGVCCVDWQDELIIGDVREAHIRDIWFSERYHLVRQILWRKRRDLLVPCRNCDDPTSRVGLIPRPETWEDLMAEELFGRFQETRA